MRLETQNSWVRNSPSYSMNAMNSDVILLSYSGKNVVPDFG